MASTSGRERKPTQKGAAYSKEIKFKGLDEAWRVIKSKSDEIRELMGTNPDVDEMTRSHKEWMDAFEDFLHHYEQYCKLLDEGERLLFHKDWFSDKEVWLSNVRSTIQDLMIKLKSPKSSKASTSSKRSRASQLLIQEEQKKAELLARQRALKEKQSLELERMKLKLREEEIQIKTEVAVSEARCKVLENFERDSQASDHDKASVDISEKGGAVIVTGTQLEASSDVHVSGEPEIDNDKASSVKDAESHEPSHWMTSFEEFLDHYEVGNTSKTPKQSASRLASETKREGKPPNQLQSKLQVSDSVHGQSVNEMVRHLQRPKLEIEKFSGEAIEFSRFMRMFNARVAKLCDTDDERLYYLEQLTTGEAHKIVMGYSYLDGTAGYTAAMRELKERYGNPEVIANAFIKRAAAWPPIKADNPKALDAYAIFLSECESAVKCVGSMQYLEYSENIKTMVMKLPYSCHDRWRSRVQQCKDKGELVKFHHFVEFVKFESKKINDPVYGRDALSVSPVSQKAGASRVTKPKIAMATRKTEDAKTPKDGDKRVCWFCSGSHLLKACSLLRDRPLSERIEFVRKKRLCFGCLKMGHMRKTCSMKSTCDICNGRHPTLLHASRGELLNNPEASSREMRKPAVKHVDVSVQCTNVACNKDSDEECTLAIVPVRVSLTNGIKDVVTYAFLDPGSSVSFCSEALMNKLCGVGRRMRIWIDTMGEPHRMDTYMVEGLRVQSLDGTGTVTVPRVYTKDKLPVKKNHIPTHEDVSHWEHLRDVQLPQVDASIDLLIGNNVADAYTPLEVRTGPRCSPHATKTAPGWVAWNVVRSSQRGLQFSVNFVDVAARRYEEVKKLNMLVKESLNYDFPERTIDDKREWSQDDRLFMKKVSNSCRLVNGHYQISLPFKAEVNLPDNSAMALKRLRSLEKKLKGSQKFHQDYNVFMSKVLDKGYAELVPPSQVDGRNGQVWYIPHHGVYHPKKPEKVRVVFDCTASYNGVALNDLLLAGPNLTNHLIGVLLRFRQESIAIMGDIESMFYQVVIPEQERDYLRFYWWPKGDLSQEPAIYRMKVHLFGAVSSPSCSNYALRLTALNNTEESNNAAAETVLRNFYVDDCLKSVKSSEDAVDLITKLKSLCKKGGFNLTKWISNDQEVMQSIPADDTAKNLKPDVSDPSQLIPQERALGVRWDVRSDTLGFKISSMTKEPTRRNILSIVSSVYDPLGFACPAILPVKHLLQMLCKEGSDWDTEVTGDVLHTWNEWLTDLPKLESLIVSRCYKPPKFDVAQRQIHNFCDACERGYGIVSYLRQIDDKGNIHCSFLIARSRVSPLKKVTIPRMELTAATMAVRVNKMLKDELDDKVHQVFFWTDSTAVLKYIANHSARFHTFVANRVEVIREASEPSQWRHVETKLNPADDASRGLQINKLLDNQRWLKGPTFLWRNEDRWPSMESAVPPIDDSDPEVKVTTCSNATVVDQSPSMIDELLIKYSSWSRLRRIMAWVLLFKQQFLSLLTKRDEKKVKSNKSTHDVPYLTPAMLDEAEMMLVKHTQATAFPEEIKCLSKVQNKSQVIPKSSTVYKLSPVLIDGVLRVGGRIDRATVLPYDARHPIILPKNSPLSMLLLHDAHRHVGHQGKNAMVSHVRQKYWIIGANNSSKKIATRCVTCRKYQRKPTEQMMANLPAERLEANFPPFTNVGMDYFGPLMVKRGRSEVKRYGVIFTCLSSRAVHLEVASSLDTDSAINAVRRFTARRGPVKSMRSDNGTNLVGAAKELRQELAKLDQSRIRNTLCDKGISWEFNPPAGSHFGGVWERLIRSVRKIMYGLLHEHKHRLDDEGLHTLLCEVEAILNSRPITANSTDPDDLLALSPNDLLLARGAQTSPGEFSKDDCYARKRWRRVQYLVDVFWKRWISEYLSLLQERQKWLKSRRNVCTGDVVLLIDNTPRGSWALGRVVSTRKDSKGLVRVVEVKTATSVVQRPVDKLCLVLEADFDVHASL